MPAPETLPNNHRVAGNTAHTAPENRTFYPALDGLRAIAFVLVFAQHYLQLPWGWTGVNIFFVLSGFLITGILLDTADSPHRARNFYVRRTLRIFPLYYGIFLGLLLLTPLLRWHWTPAWIAWPLYLGNFLRFRSPATNTIGTSQELSADAHLGGSRLPNTQLYLGHFWSLCVEEQFYLFWPWIVFALRNHRRALLWICASIVVIVPILRLLTQRDAPAWMLKAELLYRATPFQLDSLLLGGLVALLWRGAHRRLLLSLARLLAPAALAAALIYVFLHLPATRAHVYSNYVYPFWKFTWGLSFVNLLSAATIVCCLQPGNLFYWVCNLRPLRWLGRISYGAYVFHDILHDLPVHFITLAKVHSPFLQAHDVVCAALLGFALTLLLAWASFRFFETPFLNLKERWTVRETPVSPAPLTKV